MDRLEKLQEAYNELTSSRAVVIRNYDRARDGTEEKRNATEALVRLGNQILKVEALIEAELNAQDI